MIYGPGTSRTWALYYWGLTVTSLTATGWPSEVVPPRLYLFHITLWIWPTEDTIGVSWRSTLEHRLQVLAVYPSGSKSCWLRYQLQLHLGEKYPLKADSVPVNFLLITEVGALLQFELLWGRSLDWWRGGWGKLIVGSSCHSVSVDIFLFFRPLLEAEIRNVQVRNLFCIMFPWRKWTHFQMPLCRVWNDSVKSVCHSVLLQQVYLSHCTVDSSFNELA